MHNTQGFSLTRNKALIHEAWKTKKDVISRATSGHPFVFVLGTGIEPILQD